MGENIRLARLRRRLTTVQVSERAGISRPTLVSIEKGEPNVAFGAYANVLLCLGLDKDLEEVARDDALGQKLQDAQLSVPRRRVVRRPLTATLKSKKADEKLTKSNPE